MLSAILASSIIHGMLLPPPMTPGPTFEEWVADTCRADKGIYVVKVRSVKQKKVMHDWGGEKVEEIVETAKVDVVRTITRAGKDVPPLRGLTTHYPVVPTSTFYTPPLTKGATWLIVTPPFPFPSHSTAAEDQKPWNGVFDVRKWSEFAREKEFHDNAVPGFYRVNFDTSVETIAKQCKQA